MKTRPTLSNSDYAERLRLVLLREWVRAQLGNEALSDFDHAVRTGVEYSVPEPVSADIHHLFLAIEQGGDAVPGVWEQEGEFYQDWSKTACFARWYMLQDPQKKIQIQQFIATGRSEPWDQYDHGASVVMPCGPGKIASIDCCPSAVWADPAYVNMVDEPEKRWPWWSLGLAAVGLGLTAAWVKAKW